MRRGFAVNDMGAFVADSEVERFEGLSEPIDGDLDVGKGRNTLIGYTTTTHFFGATMMTKGMPTSIEYFTNDNCVY